MTDTISTGTKININSYSPLLVVYVVMLGASTSSAPTFFSTCCTHAGAYHQPILARHAYLPHPLILITMALIMGKITIYQAGKYAAYSH